MVGVREDAPAANSLPSAMSSILPRRILFHPPFNASSSSSSSSSSSFSLIPLNDLDPLPPPLPRLDLHNVSAAPSKLLPLLRQCQAQHPPQRLPMSLETIFVKRIGSGLSNLGNTCFLNSVLQCLTYTPPLAAYLQADIHKGSCRVVGFCAMCAIESHVKQVLSAPGRVISPNHLVKNLRSISRSFQMWRQEDAHEYMRYLIEALQKCCPKEVSSGASNNYVQQVFGGRLRSQVKCTQCSHCSNTYDPFLDLSLEIVRAESLVKALARFTAVEVLDGNNKYQCSKCKTKVRAFKQFTIDRTPQVLTIQFKRFSSSGGCGGKIDKKVQFNRTLDIKPFVNGGEDGDLKYSLYAVLVHSGWSTHSGHYYCFVRTASDMWHILDDSRVSQVSEKAVLDQKAYMLFYLRDVKPSAAVTDRKDNNGFNGNKKTQNDVCLAKHQELTTETEKNRKGVRTSPEGVDVEARKANGMLPGVIVTESQLQTKSMDVRKENGKENDIKNSEAQNSHTSGINVNESDISALKVKIAMDIDSDMSKPTVSRNGQKDISGFVNPLEVSSQNLTTPEQEREKKSVPVVNGRADPILSSSFETHVRPWDDAEKCGNSKGSLVVNPNDGKPAHCGYLLDEWDEEYDRGKKKKVRNAQTSEVDVQEGGLHQYKKRKMPGHNPFQAMSDTKSQTTAQVGSNSFRAMNDTMCRGKKTEPVDKTPLEPMIDTDGHETMSGQSDDRTSITRAKKHRRKQWPFVRKLFLRRHRLNKKKRVK